MKFSIYGIFGKILKWFTSRSINMKKIFLVMATAAVLFSSCNQLKKTDMEQKSLFPKGEVIRSGNFSGDAWLKMLVADANSTFDTQIYNVTFEPEVRNSWHSHPGGQILLCTAGKGYYQERGKPVQLLQAGDVMEIRPDIVHWHGATPDGEFSHIGITTQVSKGAAVWYEAVTDEEYDNLKIK
jgi:quercetin dioxygenase-like cupin family protein